MFYLKKRTSDFLSIVQIYPHSLIATNTDKQLTLSKIDAFGEMPSEIEIVYGFLAQFLHSIMSQVDNEGVKLNFLWLLSLFVTCE